VDLDFLPNFDSSSQLPSWLDVGGEMEATQPAPLPASTHPAVSVPPPATPPIGTPALPALEPAPQSATVAVVATAREVSYGIVAGNRNPTTVFDCRVEHQVPANLCYLGAEPEPLVEGDKLVWLLGKLGPGTQHPVTVRALPRSPGADAAPLTARFFAYSTQQAVFQTAVFRPRLRLHLSGPTEAVKGELTVFQLQIANKGNAAATDMRLHLRSTAGLQMASSSLTEADLGTLAPDQSLDIPLPGIALEAGQQSLEVTVEPEASTPATSTAMVVVKAPGLVVRLRSPEHLLPGLVASFQVEVSNSGTAPASNTEVTVILPEGLVFGAAEPGAATGPSPPVRFTVDHLAPGEVRAWDFELTALHPGDFLLTTRAEADGGANVETTSKVRADMRNEGDILRALLRDIDRQIASSSTAATLPRATRERTEEYLLFTIQGTCFAVPVSLIEEVDLPPTLTPVPHVPPWLLGVANLRGEIVSVVSLAGFFGLGIAPFTADTRLMLARSPSDELQLGLVADRVRGIQSLRPDQAAPVSSPWEGMLRPYLRGVIETADERVVLLDLEQLLLSSTMRLTESV
jgi:purine-binding chemotaxis protein CheW